MKSKKITKTMNQEENIFDKLSNDWWKIDGSFSALHAFNFVRIKFIKDVLGKKKSDTAPPRKGIERRELDRMLNIADCF